MKILLTGAKGMLARDFITSQSEKFEIVALSSDECDITDRKQVEDMLVIHKPDFVLNCAAYTAVDDAEDVGRKANYDVNAWGTYLLARSAREHGADFVTISTDYVFAGTNGGGYLPEDNASPVNAYGMAKYLGERLARDAHPDTILIRTSWLYGGGSEYKNFVNTMLRLGQTKPEIRVVADQFGAPTYAMDLASAIASVLLGIEKYRGNILHFANETENADGISWYEFAKEIILSEGLDTAVLPIKTEEYPTKAKRPEKSRLVNTSKIKLPDWKESLIGYLFLLKLNHTKLPILRNLAKNYGKK